MATNETFFLRFILFSILGTIFYNPVNNILQDYLTYLFDGNSDLPFQATNIGGLIHFLVLNDFFEIFLVIILIFYLFVEILFFRTSKKPDRFRLIFFYIIEGVFVFGVLSLIVSSVIFSAKLDQDSFFQTWDFLIVIVFIIIYFEFLSVSVTGFILKTFYSPEWIDFIREDVEKRKGKS